MITVDIERTLYPRFRRNITDKELQEFYTLEPIELSLIRNYKGDQLSLAVRMKTFQQLLNYNFPIEDISPKVAVHIASQLRILPHPLLDTRGPKYEQIEIIRRYTGFSPFSKEEYNNLEAWLIGEAEKQSHLIDLVNEAVFHLGEIKIELPTFQRLVRLAASALHQADKNQIKLLNQSMSAETKGMLDATIQNERKYQRTPFYELKEPPENPSAGAIIGEINLRQRLRSFNISFSALEQINNDKIKHFSEIAKSYKSGELYDLVPDTRHPILLCFIYTRIKEVTDNILELLIRLWKKMNNDAERAQDEHILKSTDAKEQSSDLSEQLLEIIVGSSSKDEIVSRIFELYSYDEYKSFLETSLSIVLCKFELVNSFV